MSKVRFTAVRAMTVSALTTGLVATTLAGTATAVPAQPGPDRVIAAVHLEDLNGSGTHGRGALVLDGNEVRIAYRVHHVLPGAPHAQHIHIGGQGTCPEPDADTNSDGIISTTEGHHAYGDIGTSLTTSGDTTSASGLAIDRFPTPGDNSYTYRRTLTVTDDVADNIRDGRAVLVVHGIDPNDTGTYDGAAPSDLDPSLPLEATSPAACGPFHVRNHVNVGIDIDLDLAIGIGIGVDRS